MSIEAPLRLKRDAELGAVVRAGDPAGVSPERVAAGGDAVRAAIAAGVARASFASWKVVLPVLALFGVAAVIARYAGGGGARESAPVVAGELAPVVANGPRLDVAPADVAADPIPSPPAIVPEVTPAPVPASASVRRPPMDPGARVDAAAPAAAPPPTSDLPEQIRLYEEARAAGGRREFALGLERLDELLRRFPATPLHAEADLTRAELLGRAHRLAEAAAALDALAADPGHAGRRAELLRALGDIHRQRGDCPAAIDAYTRARDAGLGARERAKVERGLDRCRDAP